MKFGVFFFVIIACLSSFNLQGQNTYDKMLHNSSIKRVSSNIDTTDTYFIEARELHDKARELLYGSHYLESFTLFYKTKILLEEHQMTNSYLYAWCLGKLGFIYFIYEDYETSYQYLFSWFTHPYSYDERICNILNTYYLALFKLKKDESSMAVIQMALSHAKKYDDEWIGILYSNMAWVFIGNGNRINAEIVLKKATYYLEKNKTYDYLLGTNLTIIRLWLDENRVYEAGLRMQYVDTLITWLTVETGADHNNNIDLNFIKARYYKEIGNLQLANIHYDNLIVLERIIDTSLAKENLIRNENAAKSEIIKNELEQSRKKFDKLYWAEILTVLISSFLLIFFSRKVYKLRKIIEKQKLKFETRTQLVENELEKTRLELLNLNLASKKSKDQVQIIDLSTFTNLRFIQDDDWESFKLLFANVYPEYLNNLLQLCPDLTVSEQRMACLHRLNLKNEQMAEMLGISKDSLRKTNQRLREKLNIKEQAAMIDYLFTIPT
jgi:hypothetical protein